MTKKVYSTKYETFLKNNHPVKYCGLYKCTNTADDQNYEKNINNTKQCPFGYYETGYDGLDMWFFTKYIRQCKIRPPNDPYWKDDNKTAEDKQKCCVNHDSKSNCYEYGPNSNVCENFMKNQCKIDTIFNKDTFGGTGAFVEGKCKEYYNKENLGKEKENIMKDLCSKEENWASYECMKFCKINPKDCTQFVELPKNCGTKKNPGKKIKNSECTCYRKLTEVDPDKFGKQVLLDDMTQCFKPDCGYHSSQTCGKLSVCQQFMDAKNRGSIKNNSQSMDCSNAIKELGVDANKIKITNELKMSINDNDDNPNNNEDDDKTKFKMYLIFLIFLICFFIISSILSIIMV